MSDLIEEHLRFMIENPVERLEFRDYVALRSGRDRYSGLRLDELRELVAQHGEAEGAFPDETHLAACLRWMLRGLSSPKAIRKVQVDIETRKNYRLASYEPEGRGDEWDV